MKRGLLATVLLLGVTGLASADYVVIIVNLGGTKKTEKSPGGLGGIGGIGGTGSFGGSSPPPGPVSLIGLTGGGPSAQIGMPPRGGQVGRPGRQVGGFQVGGSQVGGLQLGGLQLGGRPISPSPPPGEVDVDADPQLVVVVLEVEPVDPKTYLRKFEGRVLPGTLLPVKDKIKVWHKLAQDKDGLAVKGKVDLRKEGANTEAFFLKKDGRPIPTLAERYKKREAETFKSKPSILDLVGPDGLARWALEHGLVKQFVEVMNKAKELDKTNGVVVAFDKVQKDLERRPAGNGAAATVKAKLLDGYQIATSDRHHYALLHNLSPGHEAEVKAHLDRLENHFRSFYYWWALRGITLPVPPERQVAVLTDAGEDLRRLRKHLQVSPPLAESYFARREGLPILPSRRGDGPYKELETISNPFWQAGFNRTAILKGMPRVGMPPRTKEADAEVPRLMAVLLKAMENEWEATGISHETSRQLLFSTGLLPRNVAVPEWVQSGMGAFFEVPLQSPWPTLGAPSSYWLPRFREMREKNKLGATAYDTLVQVVTDGYFRRATAAGATDADLRKARATAWALAYYLARENLPALQSYFRELSKMPRDIDLDDKVLLACFARALGCVKADKTVDVAALRNLATSWYNYMGRQQLDAESMHREIREAYARMSRPAAPPPTIPPGVGPPGVRPPGPPRPPVLPPRPPRRPGG
jgi:hypothetical protein